ncbi:MAG TPA: methyltransferase domain-containing protein [bacterium]|nr:methyltransferase domain-containing protein [bacterium]
MEVKPDTAWTDDEIVMSDMTPDTDFVFARMTEETLLAVDARAGERILDVACGRAIDAMAMAKSGAALTGIEASETMIRKAVEFMGADRRRVRLTRSLAENLPFHDHSFDKVVCKGAMDHFADLDESMAEMARVVKPDGKVIIAIANFESLTCRLGRLVWSLKEKLTGQGPGEHPFWEPPEDHNFKFDLKVLRKVMGGHCRIEKIKGVSMLWGYPKWGAFLRKHPLLTPPVLRALDRAARAAPSLSDVLVAVGRPA